jgi:hypothetical protein
VALPDKTFLVWLFGIQRGGEAKEIEGTMIFSDPDQL